MRIFILKVLLSGIVILSPFRTTGQSLSFQLEPCTDCTTETYPTYGAAIQVNGSNITEDYGRRECSCSKWHRGLDVNGPPFNENNQVLSDRGFHIKSIAAGTVTRIYRSGYKVLSISGSDNLNFAYGHIFLDEDVNTSTPTSRLGDLVLARLTSHNEYTAIIYDPSDAADAYCLTDAPLTGGAGDVNYFMTYTRADGSTINFTTTGGNRLRNTVSQGDVIAPLGGSGGFEGGSEHVHLYGFINTPSSVADFQIPDNIKNPLAFLNYTNPATLTNTLEITKNNSTPTTGVGPFYGNISLKAKVLFHPQKFANANRYSFASPIFDLNRVELQIKESDPLTPYQLLKGAHFESKMDFGGKFGTARYPSNNVPTGNTTGGEGAGRGVDISDTKGTAETSAGYGDYRKTGIYSKAYLTYVTGADNVSEAYDEFYFNEYHTRIHQNDNFGKASMQLANRSSDARYRDGEHLIKITSRTIRNVNFESTPRTIYIDNFQPFIEKVEAILNFADPVFSKIAYSREWNYNNASNSQTLLSAQTPYDIFVGQDFTIKVTASEALHHLNISIPALGINNQPMQPLLTNSLWVYHIPGNNTVTGSHQIILNGTDFSYPTGNPIVSSPTLIPYRNATGAWVNSSTTGQDTNHAIFIEPADCDNPDGRVAGPCDIIADFTHNISSANPLNVSFTDTSTPTGSATSWSWNFGDPNSGAANTSSMQNPSHIFSAAGTYNVSVTASDGTTTDSHTKQIIVDDSHISVSFTASHTVGNLPLTVSLSGTANLQGVSGWEWIVSPSYSHTFTPNKYSQNATLVLNQMGTYSIKLRVSNGSASYTSSEQTIQVYSATDPIPQFSWSGQAYAYKPILFNDESFVSGECSPATSEWTITNPFGYQNIQVTSTGSPFTYYPIDVGTYTFKLRVIDNCENSQSVTKSINVQIKTNTIQPDFTASQLTIKRGETIEFRDITSDPENKIQHWGWWFQHVPGTSWGHCQEPYCYMRGEDAYPGVIAYTYNTPGTYEVRLMVHEDIGYSGLSKTITIQVEDNEINPMQVWDAAPGIGGAADLISISGDYAALHRQDRKISILKRTGSNWNLIARLGRSNISTGGYRLVMTESTIALKSLEGIYVWEKPSGGWVDQVAETVFFSTPGNTHSGMDLSLDRIVNVVQAASDGNNCYVETYKKSSGIWAAEPGRLNVAYGSNSRSDIAYDNGTLVVKQTDLNKINFNRIRVYVRSQWPGTGVYWLLRADLDRQDFEFAADVDISGDAIVAVNPSKSVTNAPLREAYVYVSPWQSGASPNAILRVENPQPLKTSVNQAEIHGDKILLKISDKVLLYKKPYGGWRDMTETVRIEKINHTADDWGMTLELDIGENYIGLTRLSADLYKVYFFEIEPVFCDDIETIDNFNLAYGQSVSNQKGLVTVGGTQGVVGLGAIANFRGVQVTIKPGFHAKLGSNVVVKGTTCEEF